MILEASHLVEIAIITSAFLWTSSVSSNATAVVCKWICNKPENSKPRLPQDAPSWNRPSNPRSLQERLKSCLFVATGMPAKILGVLLLIWMLNLAW
jgi:hypothetical protein